MKSAKQDNSQPYNMICMYTYLSSGFQVCPSVKKLYHDLYMSFLCSKVKAAHSILGEANKKGNIIRQTQGSIKVMITVDCTCTFHSIQQYTEGLQKQFIQKCTHTGLHKYTCLVTQDS